MGGGGQRKQPMREVGRDDNDGTIGSNGFARHLKQQSTNKGGMRGAMGSQCGSIGLYAGILRAGGEMG